MQTFACDEGSLKGFLGMPLGDFSTDSNSPPASSKQQMRECHQTTIVFMPPANSETLCQVSLELFWQFVCIYPAACVGDFDTFAQNTVFCVTSDFQSVFMNIYMPSLVLTYRRQILNYFSISLYLDFLNTHIRFCKQDVSTLHVPRLYTAKGNHWDDTFAGLQLHSVSVNVSDVQSRL